MGGRVHGYPGLHMLDGSIVPTALGVNPSNTLTAERVGALYPRWDDWLAVHAEFSSSGVFASPVGARIGL